ncbi:hypothetical protein CNEO3_1830003 [Clostridium neonatale]|uniref:Uncharacterized protein n=1 Tax=Clostridium neonatale TaxID=137838 RepID=A0AA86MH17_9CLOT|nr:hypothetical protein CNEO_10208 [Clostridium neonatale]CAG9714796.1 hypothetical protein CNEO_2540004 [Clostridium neonatale]CAI3193139.1 hypothetical protein CNEO2_1150004 [Clostridium neonatale]CAI3195347.1 hypothetical protein CNEO2_1570001 [Clostridium neonatale]CAI3219250.1 hypothetical protein CNEO2_1170018 [Clostridium neonatale]
MNDFLLSFIFIGYPYLIKNTTNKKKNPKYYFGDIKKVR